MNLACIQYPVSIGETDRNKQLFLNEISNITNASEGIVILPEMWICGFDYANIKTHSNQTTDICNEIQESILNDSIIISSMPELDGDAVYNTIFAISKSGIKAKYRKNILFSPMKEDQYFKQGNEITLFDTAGLTVGLHTCYEVRFPELFRMTAFKGAQLIVVPGIWPANKIDHWLTLLKARAIENQCFVAACNASVMKTKKKDMACGHSVIFDPWGETVASATLDETVLQGKMVTDRIDEVRNTVPSFNEATRLFNINRRTN